MGPINDGGVFSWIGQTYHFKKLPSYLEGITFLKTPFGFRNNDDPSFSILIHRPSTIFIATNYHDFMGFRNHLENDGWKIFNDGGIQTSWTTLEYISMKTFTNSGITEIPFGSMNQQFYGLIFIRGKKKNFFSNLVGANF